MPKEQAHFTKLALSNWVEYDFDGTARAVASALKLSSHQALVLHPILVAGVYDIDRRRMAEIIDGVSDLYDDKAHRQGGTVSERQARIEALLSDTFLLHGKRIPWIEATAAQHYAKIQELEGMIGGLRLTITVHERAIQAIQSSKAKSLGGVSKGKVVKILSGVRTAA